MNHASRCAGCMAEKGETGVCPHCGYDEATAVTSPLYLPPRTLLNQRYWVGRALGEGGFGITYLGWDSTLGVKVAVKEFLPRELAGRGTDRVSVSVYQREAQAHYAYGLQKFVEEARILARFQDHPGIVPVRDYFEANGTGYIVMGYLDGLTLRDYLEKKGGRLPWRAALGILMPVMDALREVHAAGLLHRDISPDNIFITYQKQVKLIDFGAARLALGERSRSLSVILKPGYAPEEQYRTRGRQGPWTDVYGLVATFYRTITGQTPPESLDRLDEDSLQPPSQMGLELPGALEQVLLCGLAVRADGRYQNMQALQTALIETAGMGRANGAPRVVAEPVTEAPPPVAVKPQPAAPEPPQAREPDPQQRRPIIREDWKRRAKTQGPSREWVELGKLVAILALVGFSWVLSLPSTWRKTIDQTGQSLSGNPSKETTILIKSPPSGNASRELAAPPVSTPSASTSPVLEPPMVAIRGGRFLMGSPASEADREVFEVQHWVTVNDFKIGKYEVTQAQWRAVMGDNPSHFSTCGDACPVETVSWLDVQNFIERLNAKTGQRYRLPTEAEWEYACRGGRSRETYCGGNQLDFLAWYKGNSGGKTHPVGQKQANGYGLYDLSGNVWEWTCSAWDLGYGGGETRCVGKNDAESYRVLRGGSWDGEPAWVRSASRYWFSPVARDYFALGFRLAQGEAE